MSPPLRRYLYLLLLLAAVPLGAQLALWAAEEIQDRRAPPPEKTAREFLDAFGQGDCARALPLLSAVSRRTLEAQMQEQHTRYRVSTARSCWTSSMRVFHGLQAKSARLTSQADNTAIVNIEHREADPTSFLMPGFWPTRYIVTQSHMRLVLESGAWRIVVP